MYFRADLPAGDGSSASQCYGGWRGEALFTTAAARASEFAQYPNTLAFNVGNELILYGYYPAVNSSAPTVGEIGWNKKVLPVGSYKGNLSVPCRVLVRIWPVRIWPESDCDTWLTNIPA